MSGRLILVMGLCAIGVTALADEERGKRPPRRPPPQECIDYFQAKCGDGRPSPECFRTNVAGAPETCRPPAPPPGKNGEPPPPPPPGKNGGPPPPPPRN